MPKKRFFLKKVMKEFFASVLEFMPTVDKMQNTSSLICSKFEIWGQSIFKVIQAFHTICIVLYTGCSGPACRLPHDIHVASHYFLTFNNLFKLITKIRLSNNSFKFIYYISIKYRFDMPCCRRVFKQILYLTINSECL